MYSNCDAIYVRGILSYYKDTLMDAITLFKQVLELNPEHSLAKKMESRAERIYELKERGKYFLNFYLSCVFYKSILNSVAINKMLQKTTFTSSNSS